MPPQAAAAAMVGSHAAAVAPQRKRQRVPIASTQDYEEICSLGAGAFGDVVRARHRTTGEAVAIKRQRTSGGGNGELLREARFLDACKGLPFLVGYHGLARDRATTELCLVMEYVGPSLQSFLHERRRRRQPPLPEATVRTMVFQLLTGALKMHERHVVHRDIKPANVLVGDRVVKICDLGLAVSMLETPPYTQAGTLPYMAPEVLLGRANYDARVDTWSLGCVMAELVTAGRRLFEADDEVGQLAAIFGLLGVPDDRTWPGFASMPLAAKVQKRDPLRNLFPEETLSEEGFEVLSGLLACNPDRRLTAAAALKMPWFDKGGALTLPREAAVTASSELPKKKNRLIIVLPPRLLKKPKVF